MKFKDLLIAPVFFILIAAAYAQPKLQAGRWRGVLKTSSGAELPFNFDASTTAGRTRLTIINGAERLQVTDIKTKGDSVFIHMPLFNSEFKLKRAGKGLTGRWIKHYGDHDAVMAFTAEPNTSWRFFKDAGKPLYNVSGRWAATFNEGTPRKELLVGEFKQAGAELTGTFLSISGDYRYLQGTVYGNQLYLSCFDGGHAYLFTARISNAVTLIDGKYYAGVSDLDMWTAVKDANAKLPDAYSLTRFNTPHKKLAFTFRDINGRKVSLNDGRFRNKVVIIQLLGSWCPNCMDETNFLVNTYYPKYHSKGVEIIGLAYERTTDFAKSQQTLRVLKNHFDIPYPLLITGYTPGRGDPEKSLPGLTDFKGFPTTIIVDKKGEVRKIHTGFSGPGTGVHYREFIEEFDKMTDGLLAEK